MDNPFSEDQGEGTAIIYCNSFNLVPRLHIRCSIFWTLILQAPQTTVTDKCNNLQNRTAHHWSRIPSILCPEHLLPHQQPVSPFPTVWNLGVVFNSSLSFQSQINTIARALFLYLFPSFSLSLLSSNTYSHHHNFNSPSWWNRSQTFKLPVSSFLGKKFVIFFIKLYLFAVHC